RQREYDKQQEKVKREQAYIDRYRAGQRARQAAGREKRLERYVRDESLERPIALDSINLRMKSTARSSDTVAVAENLTKGYDNKPLFTDLTITIQRGDRIGIIGPNGAGKTTLVNT